MTWQHTIEQTLAGMGFELVDLERSAGGLLRVTLDWPWQPGQSERFITVEDCERVTRQLQLLLEVEGVEYKRLEVGSPGIDRPLRREADFERFEGALVDITLKVPLGSLAAGTGVAATRKKFRGTLERVAAAVPGSENAGAAAAGALTAADPAADPAADGVRTLERSPEPPTEAAPLGAEAAASRWQIVWREEAEGKPAGKPARKPGQRPGKKAALAPLQALGFTLDELREARLAPVVDFKGRAAAPAAPAAPTAQDFVPQTDGVNAAPAPEKKG